MRTTHREGRGPTRGDWLPEAPPTERIARGILLLPLLLTILPDETRNQAIVRASLNLVVACANPISGHNQERLHPQSDLFSVTRCVEDLHRYHSLVVHSDR